MNNQIQRPKPAVRANVQNLALAGLLIALGTILSFLKLFDLPYGGSVTICGMLPVMVFAYRAGPKWGLGAGLAFSVLQLLFGLDALKGVSGATVAGSIFLDYLLAFTVLGLAGLFRGRLKSHPAAFTLGCLVAGLLRYLCSFLSGWILWSEYADAAFSPLLAGMSGQQLACFYSLVYNGGYMIPEILITCLAGFLVMKFAGKQILKGTEDSLGRG
ncbi:MAG: energy-coupled thiamine transporter ThiT [Acutalibacter sp.]|jgi:thiamine transporter|nr:energy-coupled thiamine transporter ThiT [Acutalibacter sp.]